MVGWCFFGWLVVVFLKNYYLFLYKYWTMMKCFQLLWLKQWNQLAKKLNLNDESLFSFKPTNLCGASLPEIFSL